MERGLRMKMNFKYQIELQEEHDRLLIFETGLCCQVLSQMVIY